jgi:alpha-mannosidase
MERGSIEMLGRLLMRAMGSPLMSSLDLSRLDFDKSMSQNGFDSLTQVAMFSLFEEITGDLPQNANITLAAFLARIMECESS